MQEPSTPDRFYLPGINTTRFIAAIIVVIYHVELARSEAGLSNRIYQYPGLANWGQMAVNYFFVLSGYLITRLLVLERLKKGDIDIQKFYLRRILRIWPLYFSVVIIGIFIVPFFDGDVQTPSAFPLTLIFAVLPNFAIFIHGTLPYINQIWSIGLEEQFYLLWPLLFRRFRSPLTPALAIIFLFLSLNVGLTLGRKLEWGPWSLTDYQQADRFLSSIRLQCLAIGAVGAWIHHQKPRWLLAFIYHPAVQILVLGLTAVLLSANVEFSTIHHEIYCVLFLIIILNLTENPRSLIKLDFACSDALGNISYAIYMIHGFAIGITLFLLKPWHASHPDHGALELLSQVLALGLTLLLSYASYRWLERPFLKLKKSFTRIPSGRRTPPPPQP